MVERAISTVERRSGAARDFPRRDGSPPRRTVLLVILVSFALVAAGPLVLPRYWMFLVSTLFAYSIAVMGLKVLFGDCGQLSLAQAAFVGVGAYSAALVSTNLRLTFPYELFLVIVISGVIALIIALPALRVGGLRLALLTLAFGELFQWWLREAKDTTGGEQGLFVPVFFLGQVDSRQPIVPYLFTAAIALAVTVLVWHLPRTRIGRAMAAVRESELAAASVGVSVRRTKLFAFVVAGVLAGISGCLLAHVTGSISPTTFDLFGSVYILIAVIVGGSHSVLGAWIGAAYLVLLPAFFTSLGFDRLYVVISGALLILVIMVFPGGIAGGLSRLRGLVSGPKETSR